MIDIFLYILIIICVAFIVIQSHGITQIANDRRKNGNIKGAYTIYLVLGVLWLLYLTTIVYALLNH